MLKPDDAPGLFNLEIDGKKVAKNVSDGGSSPFVTVGTGLVAVGESAGKNTDLADYITSLGPCKYQDGKEVDFEEEQAQLAEEAVGEKPFMRQVRVREGEVLVCPIIIQQFSTGYGGQFCKAQAYQFSRSVSTWL